MSRLVFSQGSCSARDSGLGVLQAHRQRPSASAETVRQIRFMVRKRPSYPLQMVMALTETGPSQKNDPGQTRQKRQRRRRVPAEKRGQGRKHQKNEKGRQD